MIYTPKSKFMMQEVEKAVQKLEGLNGVSDPVSRLLKIMSELIPEFSVMI